MDLKYCENIPIYSSGELVILIDQKHRDIVIEEICKTLKHNSNTGFVFLMYSAALMNYQFCNENLKHIIKKVNDTSEHYAEVGLIYKHLKEGEKFVYDIAIFKDNGTDIIKSVDESRLIALKEIHDAIKDDMNEAKLEMNAKLDDIRKSSENCYVRSIVNELLDHIDRI